MSQQPSESGTNHLDVPEGDAQELPVTQSSTATTGTASDAGEMLARGDRVIFGVKFHPELAPIEAAYRSIGRALQVANSAGNSAGFKARVQQCQDPPDLTLSLVRKHFRSAREYLKLYVEGKTLAEIEQLRKVKRKHRGPAPALSQAGESSQPSKSGKYPRNRV